MEIGRAFAYIFEDKKWLTKLLPLMLVGFVSLIPIFGLIATALGMGYLLHLARNVRQGLPRPLPEWGDWQVKLNDGAQVLIAVIIYSLPSVLVSICSYTMVSGLASGFLGGAVTIVVICCTTPFVLVYTALAWSMLGIGITEYMETGESGRMYRFWHLWDVLRANGNAVFQWAFYTLLINLIFGFIGAIPCIGWIFFFMFAYPVQGHLLGQFAHRIGLRNKPKKKAAQTG